LFLRVPLGHLGFLDFDLDDDEDFDLDDDLDDDDFNFDFNDDLDNDDEDFDADLALKINGDIGLNSSFFGDTGLNAFSSTLDFSILFIKVDISG
jgi:hypothetical protein